MLVEVGPSDQNHDSEDSDENDEMVHDSRDRGLSDNGWESEELFSIKGSASETEHDGINTCGFFGTFKKPKSMVDCKWEVATTFVDKAQFVDGVRTYVVHVGRNLKFKKNDKERVRVRCLGAHGKCDWFHVKHGS